MPPETPATNHKLRKITPEMVMSRIRDMTASFGDNIARLYEANEAQQKLIEKLEARIADLEEKADGRSE